MEAKVEEMAIGFDDYSVNRQLLVSLTLEEATGTVTFDRAKPHRELALHGPPTWVQVPSGLGVLEFDGAGDHLDCPAADTADLDFTTEDYSIAGWIYLEHMVGLTPRMLIARYELDVSGWEVYLEENTAGVLQMRHNHGGVPTRTGAYSLGWWNNEWYFLGITRHGASAQHYRNGESVEVTNPVGLQDPAPCAQDLVVGCRFTKDTDWYHGKIWNLRLWDRELSQFEVREIFEVERHWMGV